MKMVWSSIMWFKKALKRLYDDLDEKTIFGKITLFEHEKDAQYVSGIFDKKHVSPQDVITLPMSNVSVELSTTSNKVDGNLRNQK